MVNADLAVGSQSGLTECRGAPPGAARARALNGTRIRRTWASRTWATSNRMFPSASIVDCASRPLFVFNGPVHGLDRGLCLHKPLARLFGLAAVVGAGEHADKCAPLLDQ